MRHAIRAKITLLTLAAALTISCLVCKLFLFSYIIVEYPINAFYFLHRQHPLRRLIAVHSFACISAFSANAEFRRIKILIGDNSRTMLAFTLKEVSIPKIIAALTFTVQTKEELRETLGEKTHIFFPVVPLGIYIVSILNIAATIEDVHLFNFVFEAYKNAGE